MLSTREARGWFTLGVVTSGFARDEAEAYQMWREWYIGRLASVWDYATLAYETAHKQDPEEPWAYLMENPYDQDRP